MYSTKFLTAFDRDLKIARFNGSTLVFRTISTGIATRNTHLSDRTVEAVCCTSLSDTGNCRPSAAGALVWGAGCSQERGVMIGWGQQGSHPSQETMGEAACRMASYLTVSLLILASSILL